MLNRRALLAGLATATPLILPATRALAQDAVPLPPKAPATAEIDTTQLAPGSYIWHPELSPDGPVAMIVSLPDQLVHVYRNGVEIGVSTVSTGKPGHETPTGVFVILQKDRDHRSSTYNNAPMPNMQRLTWGGVALHAGNLPGFPASHGCIRLPRGFSEALFEITDLGIPVIIADTKSQPETVIHPGLLLPPEAAEQTAAAVVAASNRSGKDVDPALDAHKHVSMVVSGADRTAIMMLGGSEVWRSTIKIRGEGPLGDHVYKLMGPAENGEGLEWLAHKIYTVDEGGANPAAVLARIEIVDWPEAVEILADLAPGSTLVVTDLPATPETRHEGGDFIIIRSEDA